MRTKVGMAILALLVIVTVCVAQSRFTKQDTASVNPYTDVSKSYTNVKRVYICNPGIAMRITVASDADNEDTGKYWSVPATCNWDSGNVDWAKVTLKIRGESTASDTGTSRIWVAQ